MIGVVSSVAYPLVAPSLVGSFLVGPVCEQVPLVFAYLLTISAAAAVLVSVVELERVAQAELGPVVTVIEIGVAVAALAPVVECSVGGDPDN